MFDIGKRIMHLRSLHNLSANKLSKELKVDPSTINKIEKGTAKPSIDLLFNICEFFDISMGEFFNSESNDLPPDLLQLIETAKKLPEEERKALNHYLQIRLKG